MFLIINYLNKIRLVVLVTIFQFAFLNADFNEKSELEEDVIQPTYSYRAAAYSYMKDSIFYTARSMPHMADHIADLCYACGDKEIALELDKMAIEKYSFWAFAIFEKWVSRGETDVASELEKLYPRIALGVLDKLINNGNFAQAEEYGNKMLEYWISQKDEDIQNNINDKLKLSVRMHSGHYYEILKSKLSNIEKDILHNYSKYLENLPLNPSNKELSITDYLTRRAYINPEVLNKYNITIEEARMMLEIDLYELAKKSEIIFSILHAIALHAKTDPYFRLDIFYEIPILDGNYSGVYRMDLKCVDINSYPLRSNLIKGVISHEWTHQLMDILFDNNPCNPYPKENNTAKAEWGQIMEGIWKRLSEVPESLKSMPKWDLNINAYERMLTSFESIKSYTKNFYDAEAIARFSETIGTSGFEDPNVKEFLQPIYDYWMKYIEPAINKYIQNHAKEDTFVSDWERENILDPFYRAEIDGDEYKSDLRMGKGKPDILKFISEKWFNHGNIEHAVEFHKIYLEHHNYMLGEMADLWYGRGEKEIAFEFDKIAIEKYPYQADEIANKWYDRGEKEIALEFDKIAIEKHSYKAVEIANKWYDRGEKKLALEFYKLASEKHPYKAKEIADKWYDRGKKELALEFDNIYVRESSIMAEKIADKWYDRGEKEIALEFDNIYLRESSIMADKIANKWYDRGEKEIALKFDKTYVAKYSYRSDNIVKKWDKRGHPEIAKLFIQ